jgi:hypothetical protein
VQCITAGCTGEWRVDHLPKNPRQSVWWACKECGYQFSITPRLLAAYDIEATGDRQTPTTVTLMYDGTAPIVFRLNTPKYVHSQNDTPDEYFANQKYFYEENTCPNQLVSRSGTDRDRRRHRSTWSIQIGIHSRRAY